ncbi:MAG: amidohydrolase family protein [Verrucomicrobiia bacterium]|jgi:predicted TIM-barrel fold metal-dependent hydrolase
MICDIHVHLVAGADAHSGNYISPRLARSWGGRILARQFRGGDRVRKTLAWLDDSPVDRAVLLALDGAYRHDGTPDPANTLLVSDNDFVASIAESNPKALFGASVHPYRRDALSVLEKVIRRGACLVKWLPAAQNIAPDDPRCRPFYEILAHHRVPLLCHTGTEHTLRRFSNTLNDPRRLVPALQQGVTVIAAHCGTRLMLHERNYLPAWRRMALEYERFFGDISAFGVITRMWPLQTLLEEPALTAKLVFGSDFPAWTMPLCCGGQVGWRVALQLRRIKNPFTQAVETMRAAGVPAAVFARGASLLRVPAKKLLREVLVA